MNNHPSTKSGTAVKKRLQMAAAICLLVLIVFSVGNLWVGDQLRAISSITKLRDHLYYMEYKGDYGLAAFLEQGGAASDDELTEFMMRFLTKGLYKYQAPERLMGCSTIAAKLPGGGYHFGRNFDLDDSIALIVRTVPEDGYESISTTNLKFLGFKQDTTSLGLMDKFVMLASVFAPLDGMNEKGLCVAVLVISHPERTNQNTDKPDLTTTSAVRLLLDRAANVEEALELLSQYDMHASVDYDYHFAISDAAGRSVVVEYIRNEMHVVEIPVVTNHFLTPGDYYLRGRPANDRRFETLMEHLQAGDGVLSHDELKNALAAAVQQKNISTQWSIVYDQSALRLAFYHRQDFDNPLYFDIGAKSR